MEHLGGPVPTPLAPRMQSDPEMPYWKPRIELDERVKAFTYPLLRDFHHRWRHVLRNDFNFTTLRVLANAVIRLSTLDFEVRENTGGNFVAATHVWITHLPPWDPLSADIQRAGSLHIVLCQDIQEGLLKAKQHLATRQFSVAGSQQATKDAEPQADYLILSVKHIVLCHATSPTSLKTTAPEPLFNGDSGSEPSSDLALDYLIWATASARILPVTPLQSLPLEVQNLILTHVSTGTVEAAKEGCLLGLGTPFSWKDGHLKVELTARRYTRPTGSSVESQIWFGEHKSGVVYLARRGRPSVE